MLLNSTLELLIITSSSSSSPSSLPSLLANSSNRTQSFHQMVNSSFVISVVSLLNQNMEFKNFVFYLSPRLYRDREGSVSFLNDFRNSFPKTPIMIITDNSNSMLGLLDTPSLCLIMTTKWNDPIMKLAALSLNKMRYFTTIFLYFPVENYSAIHQTFEWFKEFDKNINLIYNYVWERRFLNTILMTINNNIYLYEAYPTGRVINKTSIWKVDDFFRKEKLNLRGWNITTPVRFDLPRVFCMKRFPHNRRDSKLSGTSGKLFGSFIKFINGSFDESSIEEHEFEPFQAIDLLRMIEHDESGIEISVHSYTSMFNVSTDTSYPVGINDWCLMVPYRNNSLENLFLRKSLQPNSWYLICFAALYITVGIWLCTPVQERDLSLSFLESISALLLISPQKLLPLPHLRLRVLFILLFVLGFCLTNTYLSKMATRLTASSDENQIDTQQDVIDANLKIMVSQIDYKTLVNMNLEPAFLKLLIPADERIVNKHRETFNTTYGYTVTTDRWNFLNKQQGFLKKPLFRLTSACVGPFYHVFPLAANSDLTQPLMEFILDVQQSGLSFFWETEAFYDALFLDYVRMLNIDRQFTPLSMNFFHSIYYVWFFGMLLGALALFLEFVLANFIQVRKLIDKYFK